MKKILAALLGTVLAFSMIGCSGEATVKETFDDGLKPYYEMSDGTWKCGDVTYAYRLEICGRMPNAAKAIWRRSPLSRLIRRRGSAAVQTTIFLRKRQSSLK